MRDAIVALLFAINGFVLVLNLQQLRFVRRERRFFRDYKREAEYRIRELSNVGNSTLFISVNGTDIMRAPFEVVYWKALAETHGAPGETHTIARFMIDPTDDDAENNVFVIGVANVRPTVEMYWVTNEPDT